MGPFGPKMSAGLYTAAQGPGLACEFSAGTGNAGSCFF